MRGAFIVLLLCSAAGAAAGDRTAQIRLRDVAGRELRPFATGGRASVVFFVATDCPVSNAYAPEIQRVCREYGPRGVGCSLIYEDIDNGTPQLLDRQVRSHLHEYGYGDLDAAIDRSRSAAMAAKATITPTAVIVDRDGGIRYRGR